MGIRLTMDPTGGIVSYVLIKLADFICNEAALHGNHRRDLEWVQDELEMMQAFFEDAANMEATDKKTVICIKGIRKLAVKAEDVVDTLSLHLGNAAPRSFFPRFASRIRSKLDFGAEIKKLKKILEAFKKRMEFYQITFPRTRTDGSSPQSSRSRAARYVEDEDMVGLIHPVKAVIDRLGLEGSKRAALHIVGMSGIGKTTLARKIYNSLKSSFDCSAWVDVSCRGNISVLIRRIARDIMNFSTEDEPEMLDQDALRERLCEFLKSKKYLIVLDDVRELTTWGQLDPILPDEDKGSRIIITAVEEDMAVPMPSYKLLPLDKENGRILFTKHAFPGEGDPEQRCPEELRGLRDEFVRKCREIPIAIIVLGRLLSTKERTHDSWSKVIQKMNWERNTNEEQCLEILQLSYANLPHPLRWCFLFLAALPEVCEVPTVLLKRLWIAERFIPEQREKSLEETADEYLEELIQRGFIHIVERASNGSAQVCRVHDLFLQLAISFARELDFLDVWRSTSEEYNDALLRRISLTYDRNKGFRRLQFGLNKLRTLIIMDRKDWERRQGEQIEAENDILTSDRNRGAGHLRLGFSKLRTLVIRDRKDWECRQGGQIEAENSIQWSKFRKNLQLLRVLALGSHVKPLPQMLVDMANLRYLELSGDKIKELPSSLGNLRNLQTLDVGRTGVRSLPKSVWLIKTLRYLYGSVLSTEVPRPDDESRGNFEKLTALRNVRDGSWMEYILLELENLKELEIRRDSDAEIPHPLYRALKSLESLTVLILVRMKHSHAVSITFDMGKIFTSHSHVLLHTLELSEFWIESSDIEELPRNLKQVKFACARINSGIIKLLGKLRFLHLLALSQVSFIERDMFFSSDWFPRLHVLGLDDLDIKTWKMDEHSLPLLRELEIGRCSEELEALPEGLWHITTLKSLTLRGVREELVGKDHSYVRHIERLRIYPC